MKKFTLPLLLLLGVLLSEASSFILPQKLPSSSSTSSRSKIVSTRASSTEYAALSPGTVVQIQVGDPSLARKAWKKRRRSGSPLLMPCSILGVDRRSMVLWNLIYILEKFGVERKGSTGIEIKSIPRHYRTHLKASLSNHAAALGYDDTDDMIYSLLDSKVQDNYGITVEDGWIMAPISRRSAHRRAAKATLLQVSEDDDDPKRMKHTGMIRQKQPKQADQPNDSQRFLFLPLSAALRVNTQRDNNESVPSGSIHSAAIHAFDPMGDANVAPLMTLTFNPYAREGLKFRKQFRKGQGPFEARIVKRLNKNTLRVECLHEKLSGTLHDDSSDRARVQELLEAASQNRESDESLSLMDFLNEDTLEKLGNDDMDGEEVTEDITDQFLFENGSLSHRDPSTGDVTLLVTEDDDEEDDDELGLWIEDDDDDESEDEAIEALYHPRESYQRRRLQVGDIVEVYVAKASRRSTHFKLASPRDKASKKAGEAQKKLERLAKKLGGTLDRVLELKGQECDGVVKATSHTGDWLYVQPNLEDVPVGVATVDGDGLGILTQGDPVRIRMEGIDESRGQLAMTVLGKLSP